MLYKNEFSDLLNRSNMSLDISKDPFTLLFVYPGVGVGKVFKDLAGCTKQLCKLSSTQDKAKQLGVQIAALSTIEMMSDTLSSSYFPIGTVPTDAIPKDLVVMKGKEKFFARAAYLLHPDGKVERWVESDGIRMVDDGFRKVEQAYLRFVQTVTQDLISSDLLKDCVVSVLPNGADSLSVLAMNLTNNYVLKRVHTENTDKEINYMLYINANNNSIFPTIYSQNIFGSERWLVMDKLIPLKDHSITRLVQRLSIFYQKNRSDTAVDIRYHLHQRFLTILGSEGFSNALKQFNIIKDNVYSKMIILNGRNSSSIESMLNDLKLSLPLFKSQFVSYIHGDVHWPNILENVKSEIKLIDPRLTWDETFSIDGYYDPTYDFATLLHSCILDKLDFSDIFELNEVEIVITDKFIELAEKLEYEVLLSIMNYFPELADEPLFVCKLRIFCANATFGWLKYRDLICSREKWHYYFGLTLYWLDKALKTTRGNHEENSTNFYP
ncbi:hypothetical protein [Vibrio cholerae]|uniref:hypothetical protein n=1 Tax=Vibrio cholerae TaxID=666 RepID=UPI0010FF5BF0|nr:hypothetical protein [Vibrio cholerae]TLE09780.1 hypothetical protein D2B32_17435 [Vibrio cholerae]